jgi:hypothetical protein
MWLAALSACPRVSFTEQGVWVSLKGCPHWRGGKGMPCCENFRCMNKEVAVNNLDAFRSNGE